MSANTVYLITGASRGLGHHMTSVLLQRPNTTVLPCARSASALAAFPTLPRHASSTCIPLSIDSASDTDVPAAVGVLHAEGITSIDVVVASAGMVNSLKTIIETTPEEIMGHVDINCCGVLRLIKGLWGIIGGGTEDGGKGKRFVVLSSSLGSIEGMEPMMKLAYGVSKAAVNYVTKNLDQEWAGCAVAVHPGWSKTEMGDFTAKTWGFKEPPMEVADAADAVLKLIDGFTREKDGGKFISYDGTILPW